MVLAQEEVGAVANARIHFELAGEGATLDAQIAGYYTAMPMWGL